MASYFDHDKLEVYQSALSFVVIVDEVAKALPRGRAYLVDQLLRAGSSITLNIAEGAGEFSPNEKIRFYRMAKRSATECASILDICSRLQLVDESLVTSGREVLLRIVSMLVKMTH